MFFDPGGDGWDIEDVAKILGVIALIGGFVAAVGRVMLRSLDKHMSGIAERLDERTKPIQPTANGGKSLPDVAAKLDLVLERQHDIAADVTELRSEQAAIAAEFRSDIRTLGARLNQHATDRTIHTKG